MKYLTRIIRISFILLLLVTLLERTFVEVTAQNADDDIEDIYSAPSPTKLSQKKELSEDNKELFVKIHKALLNLPSPIVERLQLGKRVPVLIKLHEAVVNWLNKVLPSQLL